MGFPEDDAVLMVNRHILELPVSLPVAGAVVLDLDDDAPYLTVREVEDILDDGRVPSLPADIADKNREPAARLEAVVTPLQAEHQYATGAGATPSYKISL